LGIESRRALLPFGVPPAVLVAPFGFASRYISASIEPEFAIGPATKRKDLVGAGEAGELQHRCAGEDADPVAAAAQTLARRSPIFSVISKATKATPILSHSALITVTLGRPHLAPAGFRRS
jgi:hypothetical protein